MPAGLARGAAAKGEAVARIYAKTERGRREIQTREHRLSAGLRSLLVLVDGVRDEHEIARLATGLGAPDDALAQLARLGLIAPQVADQSGTAPCLTARWGEDPERTAQLAQWMGASVRRHLGLKGFRLQRRIERCRSGPQLEQLWPEIADALGRARDPVFAQRWLEEARTRVLRDELLKA